MVSCAGAIKPLLARYAAVCFPVAVRSVTAGRRTSTGARIPRGAITAARTSRSREHALRALIAECCAVRV